MFKTELERNIIDAVFKAKLLIESRHPKEKDLEWTYAVTMNATEIRSRVELYVLNVKQPFGVIVASYVAKRVKVMDGNLSPLITYDVKDTKELI
jgi:hypothetical protein